VARGGSGAEAPLLAARPIRCFELNFFNRICQRVFSFSLLCKPHRRTATLSQELAQARERGKGHVTGRCEGTSKRHRVNATLSRQLLYPCEQKRARKPKIVERFGGKSGVTVDSDKTESRFRLFTSSSIFHKTWSRQDSFFIEAKIQSMAPGLFSWR